jgi:5'(3')-deoxyribonucleotidase
MRPKIAVDIDGVLADIHTAVFRRLGLNLRAEDIRVWDFFEELGLERRVFWDAYRELWSRDYRSIPLIEESAPQTIAALRERYVVDIVSCRPTDTWAGTAEWLRWRGIGYDDLRLLPPKAEKTELREYIFFVDDNPNMALRDRGRVIIYDRPWNRGIEGVRRIRSLMELI